VSFARQLRWRAFPPEWKLLGGNRNILELALPMRLPLAALDRVLTASPKNAGVDTAATLLRM